MHNASKHKKSHLQSNEVLMMYPDGHFEVKKHSQASFLQQLPSQQVIHQKFCEMKENLEKLIKKMFNELLSSKIQQEVEKIISGQKYGERSLTKSKQNQSLTLLESKIDEISMKINKFQKESNQKWIKFDSFENKMKSINRETEKQIQALRQSGEKVKIRRGHEKSQEYKKVEFKMKEIQDSVASLEGKMITQAVLSALLGDFEKRLEELQENVKRPEQKIMSMPKREKSSSLSHSMSFSDFLSQTQRVQNSKRKKW